MQGGHEKVVYLLHCNFIKLSLRPARPFHLLREETSELRGKTVAAARIDRYGRDPLLKLLITVLG